MRNTICTTSHNEAIPALIRKPLTTLGLGAIALGLSLPAMAWSPLTQKPDIVIYMAGSTLADAFIHDVLRDNLCQTTDSDWLNASTAGTTDAATAVASTYWGVACTLQAAAVASIPGTPRLLFLKNGLDSSWGVYPLVQKLKQTPLSVTASSYTQQKPAAFINIKACQPGSTASGFNWNCPTNGLALIDAGLSQVEPSLFKGVNRPEDSSISDITQEQLALLNVTPFAAGIYGITVNLNLRNALQELQFGGPQNNCVNQETLACMPSLTTAQLNSLITGKIRKWSEMQINTGSGAQGITSDAATSTRWRPTSAKTAFDDKVYICSRQRGAGTLAVVNASLLNAPCSAGGTTIAGSNPLTGPVVTINTANEFEQCMTELDTGVTGAGSKFSTPTYAWALGFQGTEKNNTRKKPYRFIKVNGVAPVQQNVWNGSYPLWAEFTLQWRRSLQSQPGSVYLNSPYPGANVDASSTLNSGSNKLALLQVLLNASGNVTTISKYNTSKALHGFGSAGYMALAGFPGVSLADGIDYRAENPVLNLKHANTKGELDSCSPVSVPMGSKSPLPFGLN